MHKPGYDKFSIFHQYKFDMALERVAREIKHGSMAVPQTCNDFELMICVSKELEHKLRSGLRSCTITSSKDYEQMGLLEMIKLHEEVLQWEADVIAKMVGFTKRKSAECLKPACRIRYYMAFYCDVSAKQGCS